MTLLNVRTIVPCLYINIVTTFFPILFSFLFPQSLLLADQKQSERLSEKKKEQPRLTFFSEKENFPLGTSLNGPPWSMTFKNAAALSPISRYLTSLLRFTMGPNPLQKQPQLNFSFDQWFHEIFSRLFKILFRAIFFLEKIRYLELTQKFEKSSFCLRFQVKTTLQPSDFVQFVWSS